MSTLGMFSKHLQERCYGMAILYTFRNLSKIADFLRGEVSRTIVTELLFKTHSAIQSFKLRWNYVCTYRAFLSRFSGMNDKFIYCYEDA